ncbi:MAG: glycosyltransferase [Lachnospiraceae bacterium]|nr:glycosyltransferase [Lachnospiraceae bacterium]
MLNGIKNVIRQQLHNRCYARYTRELTQQKNAYGQWILENERWKKHLGRSHDRSGKSEVLVKNMAELVPGFTVPEDNTVVLFVRNGGTMDALAPRAVESYFEECPYVQIAYADEDCVDEQGMRHTPWFKPQYSPDTLRSFAYYGNILAIRGSLMRALLRTWEEDTEKISTYAQEGKLPADVTCLSYSTGEQNLYFLLLLAMQLLGYIPANEPQKAVGVIDRVLYHRNVEQNLILADEYAAFSDSIYEDGAYPDLVWEDLEHTQESDTTKTNDDRATVSIIIPSKDQPDVLKTCVESVMKKTDHNDRITLELIVVDNGSTAHNRLLIEQLIRQYKGMYLYNPMDFNFSVMCNMGAARATGNFLLFLNDDMEVLQGDWLERMLSSAKLPHVGAVGAKLLYPDSDLIQHVGVTNLKVGPAHKLLKLHDKNVYYHGQNRHNYDMIGVTAACLLTETKKFLQIDGFSEKLAVAYNDVELCFALYDAGYYNVLRNDVILYHHESLSRGDDLMSQEKKERLLRERSKLYEMHPGMAGFDPFYSNNLAGSKHMYLCSYLYPYEQEDYYVEARPFGRPEPVEWENNCLNVQVEIAKLQEKMYQGEVPKAYHIEGWSYVLDMDNSNYTRTLLLVNDADGECYSAPVVNRYRKDVVRVLTGQQNTELAGFVCRIRRDNLPSGTYTIAMLVKDGTSKQYLYKKTDVKLEAEEI